MLSAHEKIIGHIAFTVQGRGRMIASPPPSQRYRLRCSYHDPERERGRSFSAVSGKQGTSMEKLVQSVRGLPKRRNVARGRRPAVSSTAGMLWAPPHPGNHGWAGADEEKRANMGVGSAARVASGCGYGGGAKHVWPGGENPG